MTYDLALNLFPDHGPFDASIADDPVFDPAKHLALEMPEQTLTLFDLGYDKSILATTPTPIAATSVFRVLSDEGVEAMYHVCKQLEAFTTSNPRIARNTRGGIYRSKFLRDFSASVDVAAHMSSIMQTPLRPLSMLHNMAHLNYQPLTVGDNVDKWHYDTLQVDTVMFVTDPNQVEGGEFQYFKGTRDDMAALKAQGGSVPEDLVIAPTMPGAGHAILMQGNYVVHQAKGVRCDGERITLVNGFSYADLEVADFTAVGQLMHADPQGVVAAEYARHMALRTAGHLQPLVNQPDFNADIDTQLNVLSRAKQELEIAMAALEGAKTQEEMKHFGD